MRRRNLFGMMAGLFGAAGVKGHDTEYSVSAEGGEGMKEKIAVKTLSCLLLTGILACAQIKVDDVLKCNRKASEYVEPQRRTYKQATVKDMLVGSYAYIDGLVSANGKAYVLPSDWAFRVRGEHPDPDDMGITVSADTRIRRTKDGVEVDCSGNTLFVKMDYLDWFIPVVGMYHEAHE